MTFVESGIVLVPVLAVLAPLIARAFEPWVRVPFIVFELILGIVVGPSLLGWVHPSDVLEFLADFGLAVLFFVAGSEIDFRAIKGRPLTRSTLAWVVSIGLGLGLGWLIAPGDGAIIVAIALSSTSLGMILPILRDARELPRPFGRAAIALGAVGEFGPLVAITLFLGVRDIGIESIVLALFVVTSGVALFLAIRLPIPRLQRFIEASLHTSGQFAVRIMVLTIALLVTLSLLLELDMLLGAFTAGVIWKLVISHADAPVRNQVESKIEGIAFGLLVPIFFIYTGVMFDLKELTSDLGTLVLLPLFAVLLLVTRGMPAQIAAPAGSSIRDRAALGLFTATGLPIIAAVTAIGVEQQVMSGGLAAALVGAGMLSALLYPLAAMMIRPARGDADPPRSPTIVT